jgi:hypothetical protein
LGLRECERGEVPSGVRTATIGGRVAAATAGNRREVYRGAHTLQEN